MRRTPGRMLAVVFAVAAAVSPAPAQFGEPIFATPLPPGPGTVPFIPNGRLVAPVLMPVGAPTAAPVAIYHYAPAPGVQSVAPACEPLASGEPCAPAKSGYRFWASADFLYGATQGPWVPPLVTLAAPGSPFPTAGSLTSPSPVLFGGRRMLTSTRPGLLLNTGYWFDAAQTHGVDASLFFLGGLSDRFVGSSGPGGVVLARPVVGPDGASLGAPVAGAFPGGVTASVDNRIIGADVNYRRALRCGECCRVDLLLGYRYLHLGDTVDVWTATAAPLTPGQLPFNVLLHDSFRTRNHFYGPQVGLVTDCRLAPRFTLQLLTKLAMGVTVAEADQTGTIQVASAPLTAAQPAGLLVRPSNGVADTTSYFAVVPQAGLRLGYNLTDCLRLNAGYTFLYWSQVRRASEQIDLTVNPAAGRPAFRNDTSDVWVQGWTLGAELRY